MLCGRRRLLSQPSLSECKSPASTTILFARRAVSQSKLHRYHASARNLGDGEPPLLQEESMKAAATATSTEVGAFGTIEPSKTSKARADGQQSQRPDAKSAAIIERPFRRRVLAPPSPRPAMFERRFARRVFAPPSPIPGDSLRSVRRPKAWTFRSIDLSKPLKARADDQQSQRTDAKSAAIFERPFVRRTLAPPSPRPAIFERRFARRVLAPPSPRPEDSLRTLRGRSRGVPPRQNAIQARVSNLSLSLRMGLKATSDQASSAGGERIVRSEISEDRASQDKIALRPRRKLSDARPTPLVAAAIEATNQSEKASRSGRKRASGWPRRRVDNARARQAKLGSAGAPPLAFSRKEIVPPVQPQTSDFVDPKLLDGLRDTEANDSSTSGTAFLKDDLLGGDLPSPGPRGDRAPTEARFNSLPRPGFPFRQSTKGFRRVDIGPATETASVTLPSDSQASEPAQNTKPTNSSGRVFSLLFPSASDTGPEAFQPRRPANIKKTQPRRKTRRHVETRQHGGIFEKLFPGQSSPQPEEKADDTTPTPKQGSPEDVIFVSLRNEIRNWIPEDQRDKITAPKIGQYGSHSTVIILSGLSSTLVDSDFYRIIPEATNIGGWAGGLVKIVQGRDRLSHEPVGRYFLMFHSHPAADAYKAELLRLHALSKRLLHSNTGTGTRDHASINSQYFLTKEEQDAARAFTLCPPTVPLRIVVAMWNMKLVARIAKDANLVDVVRTLRADTHTPAKVLVTVNTVAGTKAANTGTTVGAVGGLTADELWLTLRDDGRERGSPWVLSNLKEGIMPVKLVSNPLANNKSVIRSQPVYAPLEGPIYDEADMLDEPPPPPSSDAATRGPRVRQVAYWRDLTKQAQKTGRYGQWALAPEQQDEDAAADRIVVDSNARFHRFVVTFAQPAVAKRFVRSWHKRAIWSTDQGRVVSIDAVALMAG